MNQNKSIRWILLLLILLACLFYFVPWSTPFDLMLNATKVDSDGNEIGTTQIHIHGKRQDYLFQADRLDIELDPIDGWKSFVLSTYGTTTKKGVIIPSPSGRIKAVTMHAVGDSDTAFVTLYFTDSFDHFALQFILDNEAYAYLASVDDNHTADNVIDYFKALNFNPLPNRQA